MDLLAVAQHDDHRSLRLHLLLIIKILGVGLFCGGGLLAGRGGAIAVSLSSLSRLVIRAVAVVPVISASTSAVERRTDQLAIRKAFLVRGWFS